MRVHDFFENKIKGADGKACWDGYRYNGTKDGKDSCVKVTKEEVIDEARADVNFDAEDLKRLERISDLETLKTQAFGLISKPSAKPMKPEKVAWFKQALAGKSNKIAVIKMMYDLMLSGEGNSVIGSKNSMNPNSYRKVFNSATSEGVDEAYQNDESNLWYIYDTKDGRLKQKMIDNLDEPKARGIGYRDSIDSALRVANIIRSKFDAKKFVQKQGNQWVPVYPFGQQDVAEGTDIQIPTEDGITWQDIRLMAGEGKLTKKTVLQAIAVIRKQRSQQGVAEAKSLSKKVKIVKGEHAGKTGWIREIKHGAFKGAPKTYYIDLDGGGHADNLPATALRLVKDMAEAANPAQQQAAIAIAKKKQDAKEAFASPPPFKDMISAIYQPKVGDSIRTRKGGQIPGTVEKVADQNGIEYCWFRHPEGKLYKTPCSNVMRG